MPWALQSRKPAAGAADSLTGLQLPGKTEIRLRFVLGSITKWQDGAFVAECVWESLGEPAEGAWENLDTVIPHFTFLKKTDLSLAVFPQRGGPTKTTIHFAGATCPQRQ